MFLLFPAELLYQIAISGNPLIITFCIIVFYMYIYTDWASSTVIVGQPTRPWINPWVAV